MPPVAEDERLGRVEFHAPATVMKDTFTDARLVSPDTIRLVIFSSLPWEKIDPALYVDYIHKEKLTLIKSSSMSGVVIADYRMTAPHTLGHSYNVIMPSYGTIPLDVSECTAFPGFEEKYDYFGDDLGALYTPEETRFALWAPLASRVFLMHHEKDEDSFLISECHRGDKGVYRIALKGDHEGMGHKRMFSNVGISRNKGFIAELFRVKEQGVGRLQS